MRKSDISPPALLEEELVAKHAKLVRICARSYFQRGEDWEDMFQEGMLGLLAAIRTFDSSRGVKLATYAEVCIRRRIISAVRRLAFKTPTSFFSPFDSQRLGDIPDQRLMRDPEELVIARERAHEMTNRLHGDLSKFESTVLRLRLDGRSFPEIAEALGRPYKSVDNAVQRIRRKLAQAVTSGDNR